MEGAHSQHAARGKGLPEDLYSPTALVRRRMRPGTRELEAAEALSRFVRVLQRAYAPPPDPAGWRDNWPRGWLFNPAWYVNRKEYSWPENPAYASERRRRCYAQDWVMRAAASLER
ncbi:hypothetical protein WJX81_004409 [Elliptochloris bilobata]|uniref:Uncharacterized protein n=1 Tax=Elliptochloris bilobata TaxID=381761 RepID=A0AAW1S1J8_9CHLO